MEAWVSFTVADKSHAGIQVNAGDIFFALDSGDMGVESIDWVDYPLIGFPHLSEFASDILEHLLSLVWGVGLMLNNVQLNWL